LFWTLIAEAIGTCVLQKSHAIIFLLNFLSFAVSVRDLRFVQTLKASQISITIKSILMIPIFFDKNSFPEILPTYRI